MLPLLLAFLMPPQSCRTIDSDRIHARDIAAAIPLFAKLPPEMEVGFAPTPGLERTFRIPELRRIAQANHLEGEITSEICFGWSLSLPAPAAVTAAIQKTLEGKNAQVEIFEQSRAAGPNGEIVFPLSGLSAMSSAPAVWRGYIRYAGERRFEIWARVRVTVKEQRLVTTEALHAGEPIMAGQVRLETYDGPLTRTATLTDQNSAIGMLPRWNLAAGETLIANCLDMPKDVERGELVSVLVVAGSARIEAQGIAQQDGRKGNVITVRNPKSGRVFRARVEEKGKVEVVPGGVFGLAVEDTKS